MRFTNKSYHRGKKPLSCKPPGGFEPGRGEFAFCKPENALVLALASGGVGVLLVEEPPSLGLDPKAPLPSVCLRSRITSSSRLRGSRGEGGVLNTNARQAHAFALSSCDSAQGHKVSAVSCLVRPAVVVLL